MLNSKPKKISNQIWGQSAGPRDTLSLLYDGQISAALSPEAIPLRLVWTQTMWDQLLHALKNGDQIGPPDYPGCQADVTLAAQRWLKGGETALVVGSVSPWLEAILWQAGCRRIITLDIAKIQCEVDALCTVTYDEWGAQEKSFDLIATFSSVEHFGLGRYGDRPSRDADIKWMREFAAPHLRRNGIKIVAVPIAESSSLNDAHRIYGPNRMQRLLKKWQLVEAIFQGKIYDDIPFSAEFSGEDWQKQPLLVLRRE
jgi:hypothetical protein